MARRGERYAVQDRLYAALERLETKDTQHAAVQELQRLIREMEPPALSTLLHAAGTQTAKTSQFSRKHCLALASQACTPQGCPHWRAMLEPLLLDKLLGLLGRALRDGDAAVRGAAAEGLGTVAAQLAAAHPGTDATSGTPSNPLLACILEALGEPGAGAAAADALAQAADHLGPLDPALLRLLLTALSNPLCGGRGELCSALARLEGGRVLGLVGTSFQQVLAAWPDVLGSAAAGTGLLGVLGSKGKDFGARAAAAGALKALAAGVGPQAPGWDVVAAGLKTAKTDISKPVRDAAAAALPLVVGLLEFEASGASADQWPSVCGSLLAAEAGGGKWVAASGARAKMAAASRPEESGPPGQLIPAVHPAMPPLAAVGSPYAAPPVAVSAAPPMTLPPFAPVAAVPAYPPAGMLPPPPAAFPYPPPVVMSAPPVAPQDSGQLAAQLASIQQQQAAMAAALASFASSTQSTLQQLQLHLSSVGAGVAALAAGGGSSGNSSHAQAIQAHLASVNAGVAALAVGATPAMAQAAPDWEAAYAQLLGAGASVAADQQAQLKLLRCIARSQPVWEQLSPATGQRLMQAVVAFLQEGTALKRLLPLLWPLADTTTPASRAMVAYPTALRQQLLAALAAYPLPALSAEPQQQGEAPGQGGGAAPDGASHAADPLVEKRELLLSALRAVWE
ncbi:microtubule-associated TORTIFOLIA1 [Chlorella sorokiniana]|uniref:Microtubule-associated TORTIFOLIA1 n=1 Tax=Chlorella sorokiniana TaxID=3076 RepID=A0A2P6TPL6_CHLSO|nr:microtubule-associated TORTIFOLIA1 [Chlorella sorokiniana]|eukprot:PRW55976.1 microtubule-associated TORTIFOLIA1 [Chlorella sorokiniana]